MVILSDGDEARAMLPRGTRAATCYGLVSFEMRPFTRLPNEFAPP